MRLSQQDQLSASHHSGGGAKLRWVLILVIAGGGGLGGCAQSPQDVKVSHGKEYFPSSIYGRASTRVIADGQAVPRGGGQYLVGKPYTIAGRTYYPSESKATQVGYASWYGDAFHGRLTANGEIYDRDSFTAASPTMPLPSYARVTNLRNNYSMIVRVNDRGPYASNRIMDVSRRVAEALDYKRHGTTLLKVEYVGRASLSGSDDARLYATLRTDRPATGQVAPTMVAAAPSRARTASASPYVSGDKPGRYMQESEQATARRNSVVPIEPATDRQRYSRFERDRRDRSGRDRLRADEESLRSTHRSFERPARQVATRDVPSGVRGEHDRRSMPVQSSHHERVGEHEIVMPPARPLDLGTIPGAGSQIHASREPRKLHVARARDD